MSEKFSMTINLPKPPSANQMWRNYFGKTIRSKKYKAWERLCDFKYMVDADRLAHKKLDGPFHVQILMPSQTRRKNEDLDNLIKPILDWLQRAEIIENDCFCESLSIEWQELIYDDCQVYIYQKTKDNPEKNQINS